jgi:hypothetical protein
MSEVSTENNEHWKMQEPVRVSGKKIVIPALILMIIISIATYYVRVSIGGDRENHYVRACFDLVHDYLDYSKGEWPKSWEDLERMPSRNAWYEPMNYKTAKEIVVIDFQSTKEEIALQKPENFSAIRPVKPIFRYEHDPRILRLLEKVSDSSQKK